jgi:hypothetical protein
MEDAFLRDCLVIYIERELAIQFTTDAIIDDFYDMKTRKVRLKWKKVSFFLSYFTKESVLWVVAKIYDYMEIYIYTHFADL